MVNIPKPKVEGFVIYNPKTQLFSKGGTGPKWSKQPKIYPNIGHLKNHLHVAIGHGFPSYDYNKHNGTKICFVSNCYVDCIIYDITTDQPVDFDIYKFIEEHWQKSYYARNGYTFMIKD